MTTDCPYHGTVTYSKTTDPGCVFCAACDTPIGPADEVNRVGQRAAIAEGRLHRAEREIDRQHRYESVLKARVQAVLRFGHERMRTIETEVQSDKGQAAAYMGALFGVLAKLQAALDGKPEE